MDKDKAIQLLERLQDPEPYEPMLTKDAYDAIQMAIDALSADGDTISRKAAIDALRAMQTYKLFAGDDMLLIDQAGAQTELMMLPPAEPERIKGRWISADAIFGGEPFYCSECGENTRDTVMGKPRWNFCPNCGAKMEVTT